MKPDVQRKYREENLKETIKAVRESVNEDDIINHATNNIAELDKVANILVKRCREWYALYCPEAEHEFTDHAMFIDLILKMDKAQLLKELKLKKEESMGADLKEPDLKQIMLLAEEIKQMHILREKHLAYLDTVTKNYCPNMQELCGTTIAAKLIEKVGSLKRLALLPSSTIQLLGAEKALFRHLTRKAKSPKHGLIVNHPIVQKVRKEDKGKAARALADKISLAARLDYFKGEFKADKMKKELEERFG